MSDHGDEYPESSIPRDDGTEIGFALGGTGSHTDTEAYSDVLAIEVGVENEEGSEGSKVVPDVSKNVDQDIKNDGGSEVVNEYPESRFWHTRKYQDVSSSSWIRNMDLVSLLGKEEQEQVGHPQSPDNNNDKQDEEEARKLHKMMRIMQSMESTLDYYLEDRGISPVTASASASAQLGIAMAMDLDNVGPILPRDSPDSDQGQNREYTCTRTPRRTLDRIARDHEHRKAEAEEENGVFGGRWVPNTATIEQEQDPTPETNQGRRETRRREVKDMGN